MTKYFSVYIFLIASFLVGCNPLGSSNTTFTPLSASVSNVSTTTPATKKVTLSWVAATGIPSGYQVEQSTDNVSFTQVQQLGLVTTATVTGLKTQTTYYFRVRAFNGGGQSPYTSVVTISTGS